jgi:hypothetical protein
VAALPKRAPGGPVEYHWKPGLPWVPFRANRPSSFRRSPALKARVKAATPCLTSPGRQSRTRLASGEEACAAVAAMAEMQRPTTTLREGT